MNFGQVIFVRVLIVIVVKSLIDDELDKLSHAFMTIPLEGSLTICLSEYIVAHVYDNTTWGLICHTSY